MSQSTHQTNSREPVTRHVHERPWAADLEASKHAADQYLVIEEALDAVRQTKSNQYVELVTHESHGHPSSYLYGPLTTLDERIEIADCGRCACGGYITRVVVE